MSTGFSYSFFSSCCFCILIVLALFHLCLSEINFNEVLCKDDERHALLEFKHGLVDEADRLASWVDEKKDCCNWTGIVCDNTTGHVDKIHLSGNCRIDDYNTIEEYDEFLKRRLGGDLSPSLLNLKQLKYLDLSCNDFREIQVPSFMGSFENLRYLNISRSRFGGTIPPQLGNLTELRILCLGSFYEDDNDEYESTNIVDMEWLSGLRLLNHLDMSSVDLSEASDWIQVINTLPYLVELHLSNSQLLQTDPYVTNNNSLTPLSLLDLSRNNFDNSYVLRWIFSITSLVSLDLNGCGFESSIPSSIDSFSNLTSLESLHVHGNNFMSSPLVLKGLSSVGSNLISLDISDCGVSSSVLGALHNLSSLLSIDLSYNKLNKTLPTSLSNLCNLKHISLGGNSFPDISLTSLLGSFFECKSPRLESLSLESSELSGYLPNQLGKLAYLESLQLGYNRIAGSLPDSIGQLSLLRSLHLAKNLITGSIPYSLGGLSSLELLDLSYNLLNGSLPDSLGQLSKLNTVDISYNLLTGVVTEAQFAKLAGLKYLNGKGNNLTLRPGLSNWIPSFQLQFLYLSSWDLGPQFPMWLQMLRNLIELDISNTGISSTIPKPFWRSLTNLRYLNMSQNQIQGRSFGIPALLQVLDLSSNKFTGKLPGLLNSSSVKILDLSNNTFVGSLRHLVCPYREKSLEILNVANNHLSGDIPECWIKFPSLVFLNLENNNLSGWIPRTLGSLSFLASLNARNNKLSGRLPTSLKHLRNLEILQLARNKLVGQIPAWFGTEFTSLVILNLQSNNFDGNVTHELCSLANIQILDLADNNLSGNIPKCFNNFTLLSGKGIPSTDRFIYSSYATHIRGSASLVIKGREDTYTTILGLVMVFDLSNNNLSGHIPTELTDLKALQSLNLSRNQLTGKIPVNIGDLKLLESFDVSLNQLSGSLPLSLTRLSFLSSFNVSYNNLTGRIPSSTQLQGFNESNFLGNKLCGVPLTRRCGEEVHITDQDEGDRSNEVDWGFIISILFGFSVGFWISVASMMVEKIRKSAPFRFLNKLRHMFSVFNHK